MNYITTSTTAANSAATAGLLGASGVVSIIFCLLYCVMIIFAIAAFVGWLWMFIDVLQREENQFGSSFGENPKVLWIILVLVTNWIGALIYYFMVFKKFPRAK